MKIDNPNHPLHYAYQRSLNRVGATLAFLTTIITLFYLLPLHLAVLTITIAFVVVPLTTGILMILAVILAEDVIPEVIYWLRGY